MEVKKILSKLKMFPSIDVLKINQVKHEDDNDNYDVYKVSYKNMNYIFKSASMQEIETYKKILIPLNVPNVPKIYEIFKNDNEYYILMEFVEGENLCKANKERIISALDALIAIQKITWEDTSIANYGYNFALSLKSREKLILKIHY